jgi:hypothetical protein
MGRLSFLSLVVLLCCGCEAVIVPPRVGPSEPSLPVFVADYGYHSSVILPRGDSVMVEYAYGDWTFFAKNQKSLSTTLGALFSSEQATLARRVLLRSPYQDGLQQALSAKSIVRFDAPRERVMELDMALSQRFSQDLDSIIYTPAHDSYFVKDSEHYSLSNNCNHLTARWLQTLGCRVEGTVFGSKFKLKVEDEGKSQNPKSQASAQSEFTMIE